ncbi:hypothetical protein DVH05_007585 [Phytophthora capsici]|nr:hypothetical protein DVH05_007585 [Phytophthora capsici]
MRRFLLLVLLGSSVSAHSYLAEETQPVADDSVGQKTSTWKKDDKFGQLRGTTMISSDETVPNTKANAPWHTEKSSASSPTVNQGVEVSSVVVPWSRSTSTKTNDHKGNAEGDDYKAIKPSSAVKTQPVLDNSKTQNSTDAAGQATKVFTPPKVNESQAVVPHDANKTSTDISHEEKINSTSKNITSSYNDKPSSSSVNKSDNSTSDSIDYSQNRAFDPLNNSPGTVITSPTGRNESVNGSIYERDEKWPTRGGDIRSDGQKNQEEQHPGHHSETSDTNVTPRQGNLSSSSENHQVASPSEKTPASYGETITSERKSTSHESKLDGGVEAVIVPWRRGALEARDVGNVGKTGNGGVGADVSYKKEEHGAVYTSSGTKTENTKEKSRLFSSPEANSPPDNTSDLSDPKRSPTSKETTVVDSPSYPTERNASEEVNQGGNVVAVIVPWESRGSNPSDSKVHISESTHNENSGGDLERRNDRKPQLTGDYAVDKPQGYGHVLDNVFPWSEQHSLIARGLQSEPENQKSGEYPVGDSNEHAEATEDTKPVEANEAKSANQQTASPEEHQSVASRSEPHVEEPTGSVNTAAVAESGEHTEATEGGRQPVASNGEKSVEGSTAPEVQSSEVKREDEQPGEKSVVVSREPAQVQEEDERSRGNDTQVKDGVMTTMNVSEENVRWDQDDCDPCEVPTLPPTLAPIYPQTEDDYMKYLPNVSETTESWKDLTENLPPKQPTKTPTTRSPPHDEFIHCTKIIGNYGEVYECTTNNTAPPTPAPTQPQPGKTCIDVSVEGDATYCIEGPICSGSNVLPAGYLCPVKGDVAVKDCWGDKLPSWTSAGICVAPVNATCARIKTGAWGCVFGEPSTATDSPATEKPVETPPGTPTVTDSPATETPSRTPTVTEVPTEAPYETTPAPTVPKTEAPEVTPAPTVSKTEAPPGTQVTPSPTVSQTTTPRPTPALTKSSEPQKPTPAPTKFSSQPTPTPAVTTTREGTTTGTTIPAISPTTTPEATTSTPSTSTEPDVYANTGTSAADANNAIGASTSKGNTSNTAHGLSSGAIAGIIIACVVFAAIIVAAVLYKQRSIARQREENLFADLSATGGRPLETDYAAM